MNSPHITCRHFNNGVAKLQDGNWAALTDREKVWLVPLLKTSIDALNTPEPVPEIDIVPTPPGSPCLATRLASLKKIATADIPTGDCPYVNCDFVFGSAAEVERLWSISAYVLADHRQAMSPQMFEALVFLRTNSDFWDLQLVCKALTMVHNETLTKRAEDLQQADIIALKSSMEPSRCNTVLLLHKLNKIHLVIGPIKLALIQFNSPLIGADKIIGMDIQSMEEI